MDEGEGRLASLLTGYDLLARSAAEQAREIDRLTTDCALRDQELNCLRTYHGAHIEEMTLFDGQARSSSS